MTKAKILVVEDEAIIAMEIENSLQNLGYEVTAVVNSGDKAIQKAEENKPDLILMDIRIQGDKDGIETAEIIKNKFGIPVVFSTAYLDEERIERAKITMPFGYVLKPIQERDLKVTLEMALYVAEVDEERKKSELIFSQMFLQSKTSTQLYNTDGTCFMVNPVFCELFGVSAEVITDGRYNVFEDQAAIDSGVIPLVREIFEEKKTNRWSINFDIGIASDSTDTPSSRKEKVWIDVLGYPILDTKGNLEYVVLQHYDITERKQAEEALRESEFLFSQKFEQSMTATCFYNPNGTIFRVNHEFCRMFGVEEKFIIDGGYNVFQDQAAINAGIIPSLRMVFDEKKPNKWAFNFDIAVASDSTGTPTTRKEQVFLEVFGYPILDEQGDLKYVVLQHYDITERKQAEEALQESEEKYRRLFEDSIDGYALGDPETGILIECNQALADMIGKEKEELIGQHQRILHTLKDHDSDFSSTFKKHVGEKSGETLDAQIITKTGEIKDVNIRARVFKVGNKKFIHAVFRQID